MLRGRVRVADINIFLAFGAGVLSFASPCTLPLYPGFLSYITGVAVNELKENNGMLQRRALFHTVLFLVGFFIVFAAIGWSATLIGSFLNRYDDVIRQIGAILIVVFGLIIVGVFNPSFMMKDRRIHFTNRPAGFLGTLLIGMGFAAGWTPCTGPILAAVFTLASTAPAQGFLYILVYACGFAVPFFILAFFVGHLAWIKKYNIAFMKLGGGLMIFMGIFLYFDWMTRISSFLTNRFFGGFTGF